MSTTTQSVPKKYRPESRVYEDKRLLYELYWGSCRSLREMERILDVDADVLRETMIEYGIPRRDRNDNNDDPANGRFGGFEIKNPDRERVSWA